MECLAIPTTEIGRWSGGQSRASRALNVTPKKTHSELHKPPVGGTCRKTSLERLGITLVSAHRARNRGCRMIRSLLSHRLRDGMRRRSAHCFESLMKAEHLSIA